MQTIEPELREALEGEAGDVVAELLRRDILMPVSEIANALEMQIDQGGLVRSDDLVFAGRDERGRLYRVPGR